MAVTHSTDARDAATDAVTALLGSGAKLVFRTSGTIGAPGSALATLAMDDPAFGPSSAGVATAGAIASDTNTLGGGTAETASIETSGGTIHIHCQVATSGDDIDLSGGLVINPGETVEVSNLTYAALPF